MNACMWVWVCVWVRGGGVNRYNLADIAKIALCNVCPEPIYRTIVAVCVLTCCTRVGCPVCFFHTRRFHVLTSYFLVGGWVSELGVGERVSEWESE